MVRDPGRSPLVILALDAGDPDLIQRWAGRGYLPTIAGVMERGCWGRVASAEQIAEHGCWTALFSGISRGQHGYYHYRQLRPGTYDLRPVTARDARALPFWSALRGQDLKIAVIDGPETCPVPGLPGIQLAHWAEHQAASGGLPACAEPGALLRDVRRVFGPQMPLSEFKRNSSPREDRRIYRRSLERVEKKGALCRYLLSQDRFDLIVAGFFEAHTAAHRFWKYRSESRTAGAADEENGLAHAIRDVYQAIDREMGLLLAGLPGAANVFVVSAFGMQDQYPTTDLIEAFCRQLGYQASAKPGRPSLGPLALARRMLPDAWRVALSRHLPGRVQECLLADRFRTGTDWSKTVAFAIPSLYTSFLRVNLRGREPEGIVEPGPEYEALLGRLEADLLQLLDPRTGDRAVKQVVRTTEAFGTGPPDLLPDLFVEWRPVSHFLHSVVHPRAKLVQREPAYFRDNYHSVHGFMAALGPSIRGRGPLGDVPLLDLYPTFLSLMGRPAPGRVAGRPVDALIGRR